MSDSIGFRIGTLIAPERESPSTTGRFIAEENPRYWQSDGEPTASLGGAKEENDPTFEDSDTYDFVEISQNNHNDDADHYENALERWCDLDDAPRPTNSVEIYGGYHDYGTERDGVERLWRNLFAGAAAVPFHRPPASDRTRAPAG